MKNEIELPIFGKVVLNVTDWEYKYDCRISNYDFDGKPIDLDVHFKEINNENISKISQGLTDIKKLNELAIKSFTTDFENEGGTKNYIDEWDWDYFNQTFSHEEFEAFFQHTNKSLSFEKQLVTLIRLVRIGFYAGSDNSFVVLDYAFGYEFDKGFRDDMLVIKMNEKYEVCEITSEG